MGLPEVPQKKKVKSPTQIPIILHIPYSPYIFIASVLKYFVSSFNSSNSMNDTTFLYGAILTSTIATAYLWFMYALTGNFNMFKVFPLRRISERVFKNYDMKSRSLVTFYLLSVVFIASLITIIKMQGASNPYTIAVFGSLAIIVIIYPVTCSLLLREHFWFKDIALFWFLGISHSIYCWILVVFYVITIKWGV